MGDEDGSDDSDDDKDSQDSKDKKQDEEEKDNDSQPENEDDDDSVHSSDPGPDDENDTRMELPTSKEEQAEVAHEITKDAGCKMMIRKLLALDQQEKNKVVKLLKKRILDFEPENNQFYYIKDN